MARSRLEDLGRIAEQLDYLLDEPLWSRLRIEANADAMSGGERTTPDYVHEVDLMLSDMKMALSEIWSLARYGEEDHTHPSDQDLSYSIERFN